MLSLENELENKQLNTEHLIWDENRQLIYSDVKVKITTPDKVLYGSALKANEAFTWYQIPKCFGNADRKPGFNITSG